MERFFLNTYRFFKRNRLSFWLTFLTTIGLTIWGTLRIDLEEDITKFFPDDQRIEKISHIFQNSALSEKIIVMVSIADSMQLSNADTLVSRAERLVQNMEMRLQNSDVTIQSRIDDEKVLQVAEIVRNHLPVFLDDKDYHVLDSLTRPDVSRKVLDHSYQQLLAPSGMFLKNIIVKDPMGWSFLVLQKLQKLQYDDNFELYDNYILTKDHRHLVFFLQSKISSGDTGGNAAFVETLEKILADHNRNNIGTKASCFGSAVVAVGNAQVLRKDTVLTLSLLIILLAVFIVGFFKNIRSLILILIPALFGGLFSLSVIFLIKGSVSILALAAGSIILGIAVNYALHFLVHLRYHPDHEQVIKDLLSPLTLGSITTVLAFFCLQFTNASVLKDMGLFAGFSLIGAALCSLIFLPHLISIKPFQENYIERLSFFKWSTSRLSILIIVIVTPVLLYFAGDVKFNSDMGKLNYMNAETREAQQRLETINPASLHSIYVSTDGNSLEEALKKKDQLSPLLDSLTDAGVVATNHSVSSLLISDSLQQLRVEKWKAYWTIERKTDFFRVTHDEAKKLKFSPQVIANIDDVVKRPYATIDGPAINILRKTFFEQNILQKNGQITLLSILNVRPEQKSTVYDVLKNSDAQAFDRQMLTSILIEFVHEDFKFIVAFTSILVFVVLLISSGRLEITVITFIPMLVTWIWILGIMALLGIEFNIINVMISTFIFGLGDDYSIFVMDGLQQEYKTGKFMLPSVRTSILLSALTTISGLGVLIFAEHPALRSIATIAIIGIVCVFIMSLTLEPFLFALLITDRTKRGLSPMTLRGMFYTIATYAMFVFGSFFLTIVGLILKLVPFAKGSVRLLFHRLIQFFTWFEIYIAFDLKKKIVNRTPKTFSRPSVIIVNHSSFLDILLTAMLHPQLILLTNKWVWNSPVFGGVVRLADYYPVMEGATDSVEQFRARVSEGYSIVVFPEGSRSPDGRIYRFHKGAFYIAEGLNLPVLPLLIHGASNGIVKSSMYLNESHITLKFLEHIEPNDARFGSGYAERTKQISRFFKAEHEKLKAETTTPASEKSKLFRNYVYKGPVLEWYLRIKLKLENNYQIFEELIPKRATVLDLGCGYGFLCYMLQFLSEERIITGIDYDEEKIDVASNGYLRSEKLNFFTEDITTYEFPKQDVIVISDVLHYLLPHQQEDILKRAARALNPGGKIIIRDGNADLKQRHFGTRLSEIFSVKLLKFNKSINSLNFISGQQLQTLAQNYRLKMKILPPGKLTSNTFFILTHGE
jgi:1-acyl-sn-glycerol-3-phosphate acyltransferase